jgi:hypothetical protein
MKTIILGAAVATLLLSTGSYAASAATNASSAHFAEAPAVAQTNPARRSASPPSAENPTGLPSYFMRPDGLMFNGLRPAPGWAG